jgi:hypothetical protein
MKKREMKIVAEAVFLLCCLTIGDKKTSLICGFFEQIVSVRKKKNVSLGKIRILH